MAWSFTLCACLKLRNSPSRMHSSRSLVRFGCLLILILPVRLALGQGSYVNFEGKQTRPISLSPDGTRLFAVNTPDARLSVFDVTHPLNPFLIAEIPVGVGNGNGNVSKRKRVSPEY